MASNGDINNPLANIEIVGEGFDALGRRFIKLRVKGSGRDLPPYSMEDILKPDRLYRDLGDAGCKLFSRKLQSRLQDMMQNYEQIGAPSFSVVTRLGSFRNFYVRPDEIVGNATVPIEVALGPLDSTMLNKYRCRGSLEGWLRTVLAQEFVNRYRKQKRLVSLDEQAEEGVQFSAAEPAPVGPADGRLGAALDEALGQLASEDRLVLAAYYLDNRTLTEIGRVVGVHESTISRRLEKVLKGLKKQVMAGLVSRGMNRGQAEEALEVDVRYLQVDVSRKLQENRSAAFQQDKGSD